MQTIISELQKHQTEIEKELAVAEQQAMALSAKLKQIQVAIAALQGKSTMKATALVAESRKRSPNDAEIKSILVASKKARPDASNDELFRLLEQQVVKAGYAKFGLKSKFSKAIASL